MPKAEGCKKTQCCPQTAHPVVEEMRQTARKRNHSNHLVIRCSDTTRHGTQHVENPGQGNRGQERLPVKGRHRRRRKTQDEGREED